MLMDHGRSDGGIAQVEDGETGLHTMVTTDFASWSYGVRHLHLGRVQC